MAVINKIVPLEEEEGRLLAQYLELKKYKFTHVPNETGHSPEAKRRAIRLKRQGVSSGFPDYIVIAHGKLIIVELKRIKGSSTSPQQKLWIDSFNKIGVPAAICKGAEEAIAFIESQRYADNAKQGNQELSSSVF